MTIGTANSASTVARPRVRSPSDRTPGRLRHEFGLARPGGLVRAEEDRRVGGENLAPHAGEPDVWVEAVLADRAAGWVGARPLAVQRGVGRLLQLDVEHTGAEEKVSGEPLPPVEHLDLQPHVFAAAHGVLAAEPRRRCRGGERIPAWTEAQVGDTMMALASAGVTGRPSVSQSW